MTGSPLRRALVPLLAVGVVVVALPRGTSTQAAAPSVASSPPATPPLVEDPFTTGMSGDQADVILALWRSWGPDLMSTSRTRPPDVPAELMALAYEEAAYVLLSARAAQVAADGADGELTADPADVVTSPVADGRACFAVRWADEPYGRTFYGLTSDSDQPGPEPLTALEGALLRTVRVGLDGTDDATCGAGGVAFSPAAQRALAALAPELLPH